MTGKLERLAERVNDCIIQARCDRRSLATLAKSFYEKGQIPANKSALFKMIIEDCRRRHVDEGAEDILSVNDADKVMIMLNLDQLNPSGKQKSTYVKQLGKEELFLMGKDPSMADTRVTKEMLEHERQVWLDAAKNVDMKEVKRLQEEMRQKEGYKSRMPENVVLSEELHVETLEEAQVRREGELKDMKAAFAAGPTTKEK